MSETRSRGVLALAAAAIGLAGACAGAPPEAGTADLVVFCATVHTLDPALPRAEALAVVRGRIAAVGPDAAMRPFVGPGTRVLDGSGLHVYPGFTDAHGHVESLGAGLRRLDLVGTTSAEEVAGLVRERAARAAPGEWILGRGWDQNDWAVKEVPGRALLDAAAPGRPVWLARIDGHAGWASGAALDAAGVGRETSDPPGGRFLRDPATGEPTGVLVDAAMDLVGRRVPQPTAAERREAILRAQEVLLAAGLTSVHDAGVDAGGVDIYRALADEGRLKVRIYAMLEGSPEVIAATSFGKGPVVDYAGGRLTVRAVKAYADGALGSRGAALLEDYADEPGNRGLLQAEPAAMKALAARCLEGGWQLCVHAIGDRGNRTVLDAVEAALRDVPRDDHRFRVEHAQVIALPDIPRFAGLGVLPSMQPTHATSDMPWAGARVGPARLAGAYAWRRLREAGSRIPCGSDFPVESHDPLKGIYAAVTRQDERGLPEGGWTPDQRMTREEALRGFTADAAHAAFEEGRRGVIAPGMDADLVLLDRDLETCPAAEILRARVRATVVAGEVVFERR
jgi:predicted amidohydrolase YtcJ